MLQIEHLLLREHALARECQASPGLRGKVNFENKATIGAEIYVVAEKHQPVRRAALLWLVTCDWVSSGAPAGLPGLELFQADHALCAGAGV